MPFSNTSNGSIFPAATLREHLQHNWSAPPAYESLNSFLREAAREYIEQMTRANAMSIPPKWLTSPNAKSTAVTLPVAAQLPLLSEGEVLDYLEESPF